MQLVLDNLQQQRENQQALQEELQERDRALLEFQNEIKNKMDQQAKLIDKQNEKITQLQENLQTNSMSFWKRLFNKK